MPGQSNYIYNERWKVGSKRGSYRVHDWAISSQPKLLRLRWGSRLVFYDDWRSCSKIVRFNNHTIVGRHFFRLVPPWSLSSPLISLLRTTVRTTPLPLHVITTLALVNESFLKIFFGKKWNANLHFLSWRYINHKILFVFFFGTSLNDIKISQNSKAYLEQYTTDLSH